MGTLGFTKNYGTAKDPEQDRLIPLKKKRSTWYMTVVGGAPHDNLDELTSQSVQLSGNGGWSIAGRGNC